ncbi:MAG: four helix bundle protein [Candidatus Stahlbacteria bacterium]|nr:four helix bundle protein [Candidatus Stahlbacteria bacterium]
MILYKVDIAFKEAKETRYWLRLIIDGKIIDGEKVTSVLQECVELIKILSTIIYRTLKKKNF